MIEGSGKFYKISRRFYKLLEKRGKLEKVPENSRKL